MPSAFSKLGSLGLLVFVAACNSGPERGPGGGTVLPTATPPPEAQVQPPRSEVEGKPSEPASALERQEVEKARRTGNDAAYRPEIDDGKKVGEGP
jgi:hypothetical protein